MTIKWFFGILAVAIGSNMIAHNVSPVVPFYLSLGITFAIIGLADLISERKP